MNIQRFVNQNFDVSTDRKRCRPFERSWHFRRRDCTLEICIIRHGTPCRAHKCVTCARKSASIFGFARVRALRHTMTNKTSYYRRLPATACRGASLPVTQSEGKPGSFFTTQRKRKPPPPPPVGSNYCFCSVADNGALRGTLDPSRRCERSKTRRQ